MGELSQKLSQKNQEIFQHTVNAALNTHFNLVQNLRVKLNTHFRCHRKRTAGQSHESGRSKNSSTEFFVTAEEICERRWSEQCFSIRKEPNVFYTVREVAKDHLNVSRATIYRLLRQGELQGVKLRGCTRITSAELERFERMIGGC